MNSVDLHADIIPGEGAAGFQLGVHLTQVRSIFARVLRWNLAHGPLRDAVAQCDGWLMAAVANGERHGPYFYYKRGAVELHFDEHGTLATIGVFDGYAGTLFGNVGIGDELAMLADICGMAFDEDEDMHYPTDRNVTGLAVAAGFEPLERAPSQRIFGMYVSAGARTSPDSFPDGAYK